MLERAQKRVGELKLENIRLLKMDAADLKFPDNSFDRVLAAYFISAVPGPSSSCPGNEAGLPARRVLGVLEPISQHEHPVLGTIESPPLTAVLSDRVSAQDLRLQNLMQECDLETERVEKIDDLGHWKAVRCINP